MAPRTKAKNRMGIFPKDHFGEVEGGSLLCVQGPSHPLQCEEEAGGGTSWEIKNAFRRLPFQLNSSTSSCSLSAQDFQPHHTAT